MMAKNGPKCGGEEEGAGKIGRRGEEDGNEKGEGSK